jgi:hypothetical protein
MTPKTEAELHALRVEAARRRDARGGVIFKGPCVDVQVYPKRKAKGQVNG